MISTSSATPEIKAIGASAGSDLRGLAAPALFTVVRYTNPTGHYPVFTDPSVQSRPPGNAVAPGAPFARLTSKIGGQQFLCQTYGIAEEVPKEQIARYADTDAAKRGAERRTEAVVRFNQEQRVYALAVSGSVASSSPATKWDQANSDPQADVVAARQVIYLATGLVPNTMIVPFQVSEALKKNTVVTGAVKVVAGLSWSQTLAAYFDVETLIVATAAVNNSDADSVSLAALWTDSVILAYVDRTGDLEAPSFGRTFLNAPERDTPEITLESFETAVALVVRAKHCVAEVLTGAKLGYHLSNTLAAI